MRRILPLFLLALVAVPAPRPRRRTPCQERRARLEASLGGAYALFFGQPLTDVLQPPQEGNLLYLTGLDQPAAALLVAGDKAPALLAAPGRNLREIVFVDRVPYSTALFYGWKVFPNAAGARALRVDAVEGTTDGSAGIVDRLAALLPLNAHLRLPAYDGADQRMVRSLRDAVARGLAARRRDVLVEDLGDVVARMRALKSPAEVAAIRKAAAVSIAAFRAILSRIHPGGSEQDVDGGFLDAIRRRGAEPAYPFVVGSGIHAATPHYFADEGPLRAGDLLLVDAAGSIDRYAADITRTFPVSGKFTKRQRAVYAVVLKAQEAAIAEIHPGATFAQVDSAARKVITGAGLGKYFLHATSHHLGLDVHDPGPTTIQVGMTFTVEPGVYIRKERLGIRLEDDVYVSPKGTVVLSAALPKDPDAVEAMLAAANPSQAGKPKPVLHDAKR